MRGFYVYMVGLCLQAAACGSGGHEPSDIAPPAESTGVVKSAQASATATRYPVVLIPGFLGFQKLLGTLEYFSGIAEAMGGRVYQVRVTQAESSYVRGEEVIRQLDELRAITGFQKFNLIGHSQGALDARYIAGVRPDLVASVTSVGGPHEGVPAAEMALNLPLGIGRLGVQVLADFFTLLSGSGNPNDARACLEFLRPQSAAVFAERFPAALPSTSCGEGKAVVDGIAYYSWSGTAWLTNPIDLLDPFWVAVGAMGVESNDGLVGRCSSHLGVVIRDDYFHNHIDETNMVSGLIFPFASNPKTLFRNHANRLKNAGL